ncbi:hypothetical protein [Psychrobacillus sp. OK032]|uniref:phage scaffolding protein n=1 Tax=Psychrobacillus sp. OK032 TaxID=1884358 RepID=UPI0008D1076F|nr:hypothetical protein [Psychrobacillus sp. OK032]SER87458.1 hypothetical protein SAMN05518872_102439 [Psychrobacillus sp. OK032]
MTNLNDLLTLNLQYFSEEPPAEPTEPVAPVEPQEPTEPPTEKLLTQAEFEEALKKRLERERKKYEGFDELKTKASEYEALLEEKRLAELSEKERAEALAKKFEEEKNELTAQLEAIRKQAESEKIRNEFNKVATGANVAYLDDAIALADLSAVTIDEDGKVVGMDDVVKALVDNKPFLVGKKAQQPIGQATNGNTDVADKTADQLLSDAAELARKTGRQEHRVAYAKLKKQLGK